MNECEKINCGYYWQEEWESHPTCHYNDPWPAPCENAYEEEDFPDDEMLEMGFNPYDGCYDYDC